MPEEGAPTEVRPMSDRRFVVLLIALLCALLAALITAAALLELRDPVSATGDLGTPIDLTPELIVLAAVSGAVVIAGLAVAVLLVRGQLRR